MVTKDKIARPSQEACDPSGGNEVEKLRGQVTCVALYHTWIDCV